MLAALNDGTLGDDEDNRKMPARPSPRQLEDDDEAEEAKDNQCKDENDDDEGIKDGKEDDDVPSDDETWR